MSFAPVTTLCRPWSSRLLVALLVLAASSSTPLPAQDAGKKESLPPELAVIPPDAIGFLYVRPAELWQSQPALELRKLYPLHSLALLKTLGDDPADTESLIMVLPSQEGKPGQAGSDLANVLFIETTVKPFEKAKVLERILGKEAVAKNYQKRTYYVSKKADKFLVGAVHFVNDRTLLFTFTADAMERTLSGPGRSPAGGLSPAIELCRQKRHVVLGANAPGEIAEPFADLLNVSAPVDLILRNDFVPDDVGKLLFTMKSLALAVDLDKEVRLEGELAYADARTATKASAALQDALTLLRLFGCGYVHAELRRQIRNVEDPQPLILADLLVSQLETALRRASFEQQKATVKFALKVPFDVGPLNEIAKLGMKDTPHDDFAFLHLRVADVARTPVGKELLKLFPEARQELAILEEMGLPLDNIESATLVLPSSRTLQMGLGIPARRVFPDALPPRTKNAMPSREVDPLIDPVRPKEDRKLDEKKQLDEKDIDKSKKSGNSAHLEPGPATTDELRTRRAVVRQPLLAAAPVMIWDQSTSLTGGRRIVRGLDQDIPMADDAVLVRIKTIKPIDRARLIKIALEIEPHKAEKKHGGKTYYARPTNEFGPGPAIHFVDDRTFLVVSESEFMPWALNRKSLFEAKGPLEKAVELTKTKHHFVAGVNLTEPSAVEIKDFLRFAMRTGPGEFQGLDRLLPLLEARHLLIAADVGKEVRVRADVGFADGKQAAANTDALEDALALGRLSFVSRLRNNAINSAESMLHDVSDFGPIVFGDTILYPGEKKVLVPRRDVKPFFVEDAVLARAESLLRKATIDRKDATLTAQIQGTIDAAGLLATARENAIEFVKSQEPELAIARSARNLMILIDAMHAYHEVHNKFPTSTRNLSWRVHILPFIDELALYQEFKLDEPWDSAHNIKLLPKMPKLFASPGVQPREKFATPYQMVTGKGSFLEDRKNIGSGLALVEADATLWTRPVDLVLNQKKLTAGLGGVFTEGVHVAFVGGGGVQFLRGPAPQLEAQLNGLIMQLRMNDKKGFEKKE